MHPASPRHRFSLAAILVPLALAACSGDEGSSDEDASAGGAGSGAAGTAGTGGGSGASSQGGAGTAGKGAAGGAAGSGGTAGKGASGGQGGSAGKAGAGGQAAGGQGGAAAGAGGGSGAGGAAGGAGAGGGGGAGKGGSGQGGAAGGAGGSAGTGPAGGAGEGGTAGAAGSAGAGDGGTAGASGDGGTAGTSGAAGDAGAAGDGGAAGGAGAGGGGGAVGGSAGTAGFAAELDDPGDLALFTDLYPSLHETLTITGGALRMSAVPISQTGWYSDNVAPLLYVEVTGDFVAETDVTVGRRTDVSQPPIGQFNQAGFVVRDPATTSPGGARWVMYNVGYQASTLAREAKTTRPGSPASLSTLYLTDTPSGVHAGKLRVCRVSGTLYFFHRHPGESAFVEEAHDGSTTVQGNGAGQTTPGVIPGGAIRFDRPDFGQTLQVGLMVGNWGAPYDASASFDYLRVAPATTVADCTKDL